LSLLIFQRGHLDPSAVRPVNPYPANYRGCSCAKKELQRKKNQLISNQGSSGRTFFSTYTTPERSFASVPRSSVESKQPSENQKESAGLQKKQVTNKASGQSMQEQIVNSNAMDDMFVAFTIVQKIMTRFSSAASEEEKVSFITKSVFSLLKRNGGYSL
jgi:hypothetical protein